jgi:hypothetical protein
MHTYNSLVTDFYGNLFNDDVSDVVDKEQHTDRTNITPLFIYRKR